MTEYKVIRVYSDPTGAKSGLTGKAPGIHYYLQATEPDRRVSQNSYRHYSFYRTPKGSEVAGSYGYGNGPYYGIPGDSPIFHDLKRVVEDYEQKNGAK